VVSGAYAGEEPREHNAPQSHPDAITEKFEAAFFGCRGCGEGSCCTRRCKDTAGCPQSQRTLHWRASQTSRFEMGNFGAELRPIGLVFPSWKLNLASFGLEIVQAPLGHPATQHEQHLHGMNVAVGRHRVTGVVDFEQQGGTAAVVAGSQIRARRARPGAARGGAAGGGVASALRTVRERLHGAVPGRSRRRLGGAMAESTPLGPLRAPRSP
jgi:hypothetical protein